jgi:hypothetical protein
MKMLALSPLSWLLQAKDAAKRAVRRMRLLSESSKEGLRPLDRNVESWLKFLPRVKGSSSDTATGPRANRN